MKAIRSRYSQSGGDNKALGEYDSEVFREFILSLRQGGLLDIFTRHPADAHGTEIILLVQVCERRILAVLQPLLDHFRVDGIFGIEADVSPGNDGPFCVEDGGSHSPLTEILSEYFNGSLASRASTREMAYIIRAARCSD